MRLGAASAALLLLALASGCASTEQGSNSGGSAGSNATVERVVDGDTVVLDISGSRERVRLIGIDTPESVDEATVVECYGEEASARLKELLPTGSAVRVERDAEERDQYDRLLGYLYRSDDGLFVNEAMIIDGYADAMFFEPNTTFEISFRASLAEAKADKRGLWGAC